MTTNLLPEEFISNIPICFRYAQPQDTPFIFDSWVNSNRKSPANKGIKKAKLYTNAQRQLIGKILSRSKCIVCADYQDPIKTIYGYVVFKEGRESVLHYLYVKQDFRGFGIAKKLLDEVKKHCPNDTEFFASHHAANDFFMPYIEKEYLVTYDPFRRES